MRRDKSSFIYLAFTVFALIFACYYIYLAEIDKIILYSNGLAKGNLSAAGSLGDTAGLINALFSGLAFGGVILTIIWQIRNDKRGRASSLKVQFENTFFNMTQTFEHLIEGLSIEHKVVGHSVNKDDFLANAYAQVTSQIGNNNTESNEIKGRALFKYLYQERKIDGKQLVESIKETGIKAFENVMDGILDHYFRYFYRILKFIDDTELIDNQQKYYYASIFRAQLSKYELLMLYFNGLSKFGREKLKPLMEKYDSFVVTEQTDYSAKAKGEKTYYMSQVNRREKDFVWKMLKNAWKSLQIYKKEKPDVVICTGVLAMIPMCLIAKMAGKKLIYIESFAKVTSPTETGKLLYKFADQFYVQWESMLSIYPKAIYLGGIY